MGSTAVVRAQIRDGVENHLLDGVGFVEAHGVPL